MYNTLSQCAFASLSFCIIFFLVVYCLLQMWDALAGGHGGRGSHGGISQDKRAYHRTPWGLQPAMCPARNLTAEEGHGPL